MNYIRKKIFFWNLLVWSVSLKKFLSCCCVTQQLFRYKIIWDPEFLYQLVLIVRKVLVQFVRRFRPAMAEAMTFWKVILSWAK